MNNIQNKIQWIINEKYSGTINSKTKKDIERLKKGEPLDYIIGFVIFLDCKIDLSKKPLIPRIETEEWVSEAIEDIAQVHPRKNLRVLDMFAGSGCIGIALLKHIKNSKVLFVDSELNCCRQIGINCVLNKVQKKRYNIIKSDIFEKVEGTFDYIVANPPYIATTRKHKVQKSVLKYEPHRALFGGSDGMNLSREFLTKAKGFLNKGGKIFMEFDSVQKNNIEKTLKRLGYKKFKLHKDSYGKWRYLVVQL